MESRERGTVVGGERPGRSPSGCETSGEARPARLGYEPYGVAPDASVEDLYFEVVQLYSAGQIGRADMEVLQRALDEVDARQDDEEVRAELTRRALAAFLLRIREGLRGSDYAPVLEGSEGRAYARNMNRAGVREAQRYAEDTLLIAGMLGVPTSEDELVLMVAIPAGGFIIAKVGGMAVKRAAFLLRRARSVDDVVEQGQRFGFEFRYATDMDELEDAAGVMAAKAMEHRPVHVGAADEAERSTKYNPWNPSERNDNCTACVASVIRNSVEGYFKYSADEMEKLFGYVGRERRFDPPASLRYIEKATGLQASRKPRPMIGEGTRVGQPGHYVVFTKWVDGGYHHVVYGRVTVTGRVIIFDPQTTEHMSYQLMLKRYGRAMPYLLEES
jgi:hypothetical protein